MIRGASLPRITECRTCQQPIRFVRMDATGRAMPVNPLPVTNTTGLGPHGAVAARLNGPSLLGYVISSERPQDARHPYRFTPHWSVCEKPAKPQPSTTAPDPALF